MIRAIALGCVFVSLAAVQQRGTPAAQDPMSTISHEYVRLVLAMGKHDRDYVDAY